MVIEHRLYQQFKKLMPIFCVDLVVYRGNTVLLCKRLNEPVKGKWYFPGGRLYKDETINTAVDRIARIELGITVEVEKEIGFYNTILVGAHTPAVAMLVKSLSLHYFTLDSQHSECRFVGESDIGAMNLTPYIVRVIGDSGIFKEK